MTVHPTIENMYGCNLCLVIMQSRSEKPVLSSNVMSQFPNAGTKTSTTCSFLSVALKALHTFLLIFFVWFSCVSLCFPTPPGLLILPSRVWTLVSCNISTVCFFADFFQSSTLRCREHDMLHECTSFYRSKRIEHCQQDRMRLFN